MALNTFGGSDITNVKKILSILTKLFRNFNVKILTGKDLE